MANSLQSLCLIAILSFLLLMSGCESGDKGMLEGMNTQRAEQTKRLIANELAVGDNSDSIEAFFQKHNIIYSYDRFARRYQAIIRNVSSDPRVDQSVLVDIYVDDMRRFQRAEVHDSFTAP